ncbi:hypothetical protein Slu03_07500 [Sediminihabitans luteus]|nr:hypothetical protein Slu03_07500 [Sediminihabitans luteus]
MGTLCGDSILRDDYRPRPLTTITTGVNQRPDRHESRSTGSKTTHCSPIDAPEASRSRVRRVNSYYDLYKSHHAAHFSAAGGRGRGRPARARLTPAARTAPVARVSDPGEDA